MKVEVHVRLKARSGMRDQLVACMLEGARILRDKDCCELYAVYHDPVDPDTVWVDERWRAQHQHDAALDDPDLVDLVSTARSLLQGPISHTDRMPEGAVLVGGKVPLPA